MVCQGRVIWKTAKSLAVQFAGYWADVYASNIRKPVRSYTFDVVMKNWKLKTWY